MARKKDTLKDNDVAQKAFTQVKGESPFGFNKQARDILDNFAGEVTRHRIQQVVATLESDGKTYSGKLGNMQPAKTATGGKTKTKQVRAVLDAEPE